MNHDRYSEKVVFWKTRAGIATCVFLGVAAILLIFEHRLHALEAMPYLPYLLLLACPLLHVFMHGGHGGHGHKHSEPTPKDAEPPDRRGG